MKKMISNLKSLTVPTCKHTASITALTVIGSVVVAAIVAGFTFVGSEASLAVISFISKVL